MKEGCTLFIFFVGYGLNAHFWGMLGAGGSVVGNPSRPTSHIPVVLLQVTVRIMVLFFNMNIHSSVKVVMQPSLQSSTVDMREVGMLGKI